MIDSLTIDEEKYLIDFVRRQKRQGQINKISGNLLLVLGSCFIVVSVLFVLQHMSDSVIYAVGVPNMVAGIVFILLSLHLSKSSNEMRFVTSILERILGKNVAA